MPTWELGQTSDPQGVLHEALQASGSGLIHVPIPGTENVYPMVPPGGANHSMIGGEVGARACR
jgi:acetolactate synthase-1/2/3 large subunit